MTDEAGRRGRDLRGLLRLTRPVGLMVGYQDDDARNEIGFSGGHYHTGDVASRDGDGYITYVGPHRRRLQGQRLPRSARSNWKACSSSIRAVAEAAVVPAPDPLRLAVPKAYVVLVAGQTPSKELARRHPAVTAGSIWPRTSGSGAWSSPNCPRRSAARSAASSCAHPKKATPAPDPRASTARKTSPS